MSGQYFATILPYITRFKLRNITFNPDKATAALMVEREESHYPPPPFNLSLYKGIKSFRLPRSFVSFLLTHPVARDFLDWAMFTVLPEEHYVPTLARISHTHLLGNGTWQVTQNREVEVMIDTTLYISTNLSSKHCTVFC